MNEQTTLQSEAPVANHITCVAVDVSKNGFILSADLMRSISGNSFRGFMTGNKSVDKTTLKNFYPLFFILSRKGRNFEVMGAAE